MISFVKKSVPMVALYLLLNFLRMYVQCIKEMKDKATNNEIIAKKDIGS